MSGGFGEAKTAFSPHNSCQFLDEMLLGQCYPNGEAPAIARVAALDAGLPIEVGGLQLDGGPGHGSPARWQLTHCR